MDLDEIVHFLSDVSVWESTAKVVHSSKELAKVESAQSALLANEFDLSVARLYKATNDFSTNEYNNTIHWRGVVNPRHKQTQYNRGNVQKEDKEIKFQQTFLENEQRSTEYLLHLEQKVER